MAPETANEARGVGAASRAPRTVIGLAGKLIREVIGPVHADVEKRQVLVRADSNNQPPRT